MNKHVLDIDAGIKSIMTSEMVDFGYKVPTSRLRADINIIDQLLHATCSIVLPAVAAKSLAALRVDNIDIVFEFVFRGVVDDTKLSNDWHATKNMSAQLLANVSFDGKQPKACQVTEVIAEVIVPYSSICYYDSLHKGNGRAVYNELFIKLAILHRLFFENLNGLDTKSEDNVTRLAVRALREPAKLTPSLLVKENVAVQNIAISIDLRHFASVEELIMALNFEGCDVRLSGRKCKSTAIEVNYNDCCKSPQEQAPG